MDAKAWHPRGGPGELNVIALACIALGAIAVSGVTLLAFAVRLLVAAGTQ